MARRPREESRSKRIAFAGLGAALVSVSVCARADDRPTDPSHGRVDGDVSVVVGVGGAIAPRGPRAQVELRLRYLETAGVFATLEDAGAFSSSSEPGRVFLTGFELRPLFLFRWLKGLEGARAHWDLTVDSIGLELGAMFEQPAEAGLASRNGVELGLGFEVPIFERPSGPFVGVRGSLRWSSEALGSTIQGAADRQAVLSLTLAWHQTLSGHLVDFDDRAPR